MSSPRCSRSHSRHIPLTSLPSTSYPSHMPPTSAVTRLSRASSDSTTPLWGKNHPRTRHTPSLTPHDTTMVPLSRCTNSAERVAAYTRTRHPTAPRPPYHQGRYSVKRRARGRVTDTSASRQSRHQPQAPAALTALLQTALLLPARRASPSLALPPFHHRQLAATQRAVDKAP